MLVRVLLEDDGEPLLECVRCYGNLSRHQTVRHTVAETKGIYMYMYMCVHHLHSNTHSLSHFLYCCMYVSRSPPKHASTMFGSYISLSHLHTYVHLLTPTCTRMHTHTHTVDELLITLLDSSRYELVYASCGVLVNLMTDIIHRPTLVSGGGVGK